MPREETPLTKPRIVACEGPNSTVYVDLNNEEDAFEFIDNLRAYFEENSSYELHISKTSMNKREYSKLARFVNF